MRRVFQIIFLFCAVSFSFNVSAQEPIPEVQDQRLLMIKAVLFGAQADAYSEFCGEKGTLAKGFIDQFIETRGLSEEGAKRFEELRIKVEIKALKDLKAQDKTCKDLDLMMARFNVMQDLKDTSYLLNGVDPATLPTDPNLPNLEDLLPAGALH